MPRQAGTNHELLMMALVGGEAALDRIDKATAEFRTKLGLAVIKLDHVLGKQAYPADNQPASKKRTMSLAARRRIAAAQRKRWAAVKKSQAQTKGAAKPAKKRKMSAAARKRIGDATRKRWAAQRRAAGQKAATVSA